MSNSAFESYCIFSYRDEVHITAETSSSSVNLLWSRIDEKCGLVLVWGEIQEGSTIHVTGSEL